VGKGEKVIGYVRVSTADQGANGAGLDAQREAIEAEAARRGWQLVRIEEDVQSGGSTKKRPGLDLARAACREGEASGLVAAKLDRLTRSMLDFATIVEEAKKHDYNVVCVEQSFDLHTPHGKAMAGMLAVFAEYEKELIGQRTRDALAVKRSQGVRLGRPPAIPRATRSKIVRWREKDWSLTKIANRLNETGEPTAHGGARWWPATVRAVLAEEQPS
jgi:DNA invertase Pin-like site-specific DNA recombinase